MFSSAKLVSKESIEDDGLPNTYDYNDSFIDDGSGDEDDSESVSAADGSDSDYEDSEDVKKLVKDAKKFVKNKKFHKV